MRKRIIIALAVVAVLVTVMLLLPPQSPPKVFGVLAREDVAEITRIVRREMRRDVFHSLSFGSVQELPAILRRYCSDRILSIHAGTNGTVEVMTGVIRGPLNGGGSTYELKRGPKGWEITGRGFWMSGLENTPNKRAGGDGGMTVLFHIRQPWPSGPQSDCPPTSRVL